jgi:hypothetical protein
MQRNKPFVPKLGAQVFPEDITGPLKLPAGSKGQVVCWARSGIEAAHRLHILGLLETDDPKLVEVATDFLGSVRMLDGAQDWYCGTVLAFGLFGDSPIVEIDFGNGTISYSDPCRKVTVVGAFRTGVTLVELTDPNATKTQVLAALYELPGWARTLVGARRMRRAVTAAVRAHR